MAALNWRSRPTLDRPVLIAAFEGWSDAGDAASLAVKHLATRWTGEPFAEIDGEEFFDFTSTRPHVRIVGDQRVIDWPTITFSSGTMGADGRGVVILSAHEPQLRWRTFCGLVLEVAQGCKAELVLTLGALLADVPHSRPVRITGTAADATLNERYGLAKSRYEGPTGILGVLHDALGTAGLASASLWAAVPHYVPGSPSPKAALALVERTCAMLDTSLPTMDLEIAAAEYERQVNEVVEADDDMRGYVRQLEQSHDEGDLDDDDDDTGDDDEGIDLDAGAVTGALTDEHGNVPSGDALAAEFERFLRDQG